MKQTFEYPKGGYIDRAQKLGHKVVYVSTLFGKQYAYLEDHDGKIYAIRLDY